MKNWMIKHWLFNYDTKVFGSTFRHLRVVNTLIPLFVLAGLFNLYTDGFGIWDIVVFIPFFLIFFGRNWLIGTWRVEDLDWEQRFQYYQSSLETDGPISQTEGRELKKQWVSKYKGPEKFVEAFRFFWPLIFIAAAAILYSLFGSHDPAYPELRGF